MEPIQQAYPRVISADQSFLRRVYNWMAAGLSLSAIIAYYLLRNETVILRLAQSNLTVFGLLIGQISIAFWFSSRIHRMGVGQATFLYFLYSGITGVALSPIFLLYTHSSIVSVFLITSGTFAATSLYGYVTKNDLTSLGSFSMMGLFGVIIAEFLNMFLFRSAGVSRLVSYIAVAVAVGLTAYDTQVLKRMGFDDLGDEEIQTKFAITGAFRLYLDFIIMFVYLLRILGNRR